MSISIKQDIGNHDIALDNHGGWIDLEGIPKNMPMLLETCILVGQSNAGSFYFKLAYSIIFIGNSSKHMTYKEQCYPKRTFLILCSVAYRKRQVNYLYFYVAHICHFIIHISQTLCSKYTTKDNQLYA
jgi:hypothetical protein